MTTFCVVAVQNMFYFHVKCEECNPYILRKGHKGGNAPSAPTQLPLIVPRLTAKRECSLTA